VKTHYDLEYIREMGVLTDMKVLAKTVLVVLTFSGR
jgi:lipopolysaccharide/colanic/teichoic acid biosynthesis glycosyltransferase